MLYDVFISHSSKDQADVKKIVEFLESAGFVCFVSYRDIPHCEDWADYLIKALEESRCVVYIHTKSANISNQIIREIQISVDDMKKPFVTYRLTDEPFKGGKKYFLQTLNWIDSIGDPTRSLTLLAETLRSTIEYAEPSGKEVTLVNTEKNTKGHSKKIIQITALILSVILVVCGVIGVNYYISEQKEKEFNLDRERYIAILQRSEENMIELKNPNVAFKELDSANAITAKYADTKYRDRFTIDIRKRESAYKAILMEKQKPLNDQIIQWYSIYDLIPSDEVKINILSSIEKVQFINEILGQKDSDVILEIKQKLQ